jgi:hypothetical protein
MNSIFNRRPVTRIYNKESIEKGRLFEEYVKNLFNQQNFRLKKWNKSQIVPPDTYIGGLSNPDLELVFQRNKSYPFAVECKWQQKVYGEKIIWATRKQINFYEGFQRQNAMPVFIVIGIGGEPSSPLELFVTPLDNIKHFPEVRYQQLIRYERKPTRKFFFDVYQGKLF